MARSFDGTGDRFYLGSVKGDWKFLHDGSTDWAIAFWMKMNVTDPNEFEFILDTNGGTGANNGISVGFDDRSSVSRDHKMFIYVTSAGVGNVQILTSDSFIPKNTTTWYHYIIEYTASSDRLDVWRDNANNENQTSSFSNSSSDPAYQMTVGDTDAAILDDLNAKLAELAFYTRLLTSDERGALAKGVSPNRVARESLYRYYPLYGLADPEPDLSGNKINSGTITGTTKADHAPVGRYVPMPKYLAKLLNTPQIARPDGDQSVGSWTGEGGETTNLYQHIDETTPNDSDYIRSEQSPSTSACQVTLENLTDPSVSTNHKVRYRYKKDISGSTVDIVVRLKQGATTIASWTHSGISTSWTTQEQTLSGAEADNITDYTDLRLEFEADESVAPSNQIVRPDGDISAGGWSPSTGTTLFETIDEVTSSDTDYNTTGNNPANDPFTVSLGNPTDPIVHTGHTLNYRYGASIGARVIEIKVALMQGATVIHEATHSAVADGFHDGTFTLTAGEAANITDYSDLRVRVTANTSGGGAPSQGRFAWAELQLPGIGARGQISWAELQVPAAASIIQVALQTIFKHNIIEAIPKSTILKHNIRSAISSSTIFKHNLRTSAALQTIFKHNVRLAVFLQTILKHNVIEAISNSTIFKHNIRTTAALQTILKHYINTSASLSTIFKHNVRSAASLPTIFKHGITGMVNKQTIFKHNIREAVNKETILKHNLRKTVANSTIFKHNIREAIGNSTIFKHGIFGAVPKSTIFKHNIRESVNKSTIFKHNINVAASLQTIFKHNLRTSAALQTIFKHNMAGSVGIQTIFKHNIRESVSKSTVFKHNINLAVALQTILKHNLNQAVSKTTILKHNIRKSVNLPTIFKHNLNSSVSSQTVFKHNIREAVSKSTIFKHNVRLAAALSTIFKHNILGSNLVQVVLTTVFRHNILGELAGEVDAVFPDTEVAATFPESEVDALFLNTSVTAFFHE